MTTQGKKRLSPEEFLSFNQELLGLARTGAPLPSGLKRAAKELKSGRLKEAMNRVAEELEKGRDLSGIIADSGRTFNRHYAALLRAGEESGSLEKVLYQCSRMARSRIYFRDSIKTAMIYPASLLVISLIIFFFAAYEILPGVESFFDMAGSDLPGPTLLFIKVTDLVQHNSFSLLFVVVAVAGFIYWIKRFRSGAVFKELFLFYMPLTRRLYSYHLMEVFSRSLGTLLRAGTPMEEALIFTRDNMDSPLCERVIDRALEAIREGKSMSSGLENFSIFPHASTWMIDMSEERGDLDETLLDVSDFYEDKREFAAHQFAALAQPVLIFLVGALIFVGVIALYLPYFYIPSVLGR